MNTTPPSHFVKSLTSFNKDLRVRWSFEKKKWVIECKCDKRGLKKPVRYSMDSNGQISESLLPEKSDLYIGYRDGYYQVFHCSRLNQSIFAQLKMMDMGQYAQPGDFAKAVREREIKAEEKQEAWRKSESYAHSGEVYDYMNNRGSQAFPGGKSL